MAQVRTVLLFMMAFAFVGVLLVSWLGPGYIKWDATSAGGAGMCLCADQALYGARVLISYQLWGTAIGAVLGLISGITWVVLRRKKPEAAPA